MAIMLKKDMRNTFCILFIMIFLNSSCNSRNNKNNGKFSITDTIDYGVQIKFDRNFYQLVKKGEKNQDGIILKNKNNCQISFSSIIFCSDTIIFCFHGRILDINSNPINNVKIEFLNQRNGVNHTAYSDSTGQYSINAEIDKPYTFKVSKQGYYSFVMNNFEPICDEVRNVNIRLQEL